MKRSYIVQAGMGHIGAPSCTSVLMCRRRKLAASCISVLIGFFLSHSRLFRGPPMKALKGTTKGRMRCKQKE